jgi:hypothetical protein
MQFNYLICSARLSLIQVAARQKNQFCNHKRIAVNRKIVPEGNINHLNKLEETT